VSVPWTRRPSGCGNESAATTELSTPVDVLRTEAAILGTGSGSVEALDGGRSRRASWVQG